MVTEEQLQAELQQAMKSRDTERLMVLRDVMTAIKNLKVEKRVGILAEADLVQILRREANKRAEAAEFARQGNRPDLIEKNEREKAILESFLPQQLSAEELQTVVTGLAAEVGSWQIGPIMQKLRERYAGRFDGKLASDLIRKLAAESKPTA